MFFIGGIFQGKKEFEHFRQTIVCKKCGRLCSISVFMTYTCFSFFFIRFPPEISVILTSSYFYIVKNRITAFRSGPIRKDPRTPAAM